MFFQGKFRQRTVVTTTSESPIIRPTARIEVEMGNPPAAPPATPPVESPAASSTASPAPACQEVPPSSAAHPETPHKLGPADRLRSMCSKYKTLNEEADGD